MDGKNQPRLLDQVRTRIRALDFSRKIGQAYIRWIMNGLPRRLRRLATTVKVNNNGVGDK